MISEMKRSIIITGGAGFIGSHVVRLFVNKYPEYNIINLDKLTYAGNLDNLKDIEDKPNYRFVRMDICDFEGVLKLMQDEKDYEYWTSLRNKNQEEYNDMKRAIALEIQKRIEKE